MVARYVPRGHFFCHCVSLFSDGIASHDHRCFTRPSSLLRLAATLSRRAPLQHLGCSSTLVSLLTIRLVA